MRVALAQALFIRPTLLLLDEPTNHLDLEACVWLEDYLSTYDRCLVVVSHSQDFLNGVCTHMMHLTPTCKLQNYTGNYVRTFTTDLARAARARFVKRRKTLFELSPIGVRSSIGRFALNDSACACAL